MTLGNCYDNLQATSIAASLIVSSRSDASKQGRGYRKGLWRERRSCSKGHFGLCWGKLWRCLDGFICSAFGRCSRQGLGRAWSPSLLPLRCTYDVAKDTITRYFPAHWEWAVVLLCYTYKGVLKSNREWPYQESCIFGDDEHDLHVIFFKTKYTAFWIYLPTISSLHAHNFKKIDYRHEYIYLGIQELFKLCVDILTETLFILIKVSSNFCNDEMKSKDTLAANTSLSSVDWSAVNRFHSNLNEYYRIKVHKEVTAVTENANLTSDLCYTRVIFPSRDNEFLWISFDPFKEIEIYPSSAIFLVSGALLRLYETDCGKCFLLTIKRRRINRLINYFYKKKIYFYINVFSL